MTDLLDLTDDEERPSRRRKASWFGKLLAVLFVLLLAAGLIGGAALAVRKLVGSAPQDYSGTGTGEAVVQIMPGDTAGDVAEVLVAKDVVKSRRAFFEVASGDPRALTLQPGFYRVKAQMSADAALDLLLEPGSRLVGRVTIPEGLTVEQTLQALGAGTEIPLEQYRAAAEDTASLGLPDYANGLEGFLFPATYDVEPGTSAVDALRLMTARYAKAAATLDLPARAAAAGRTPYDVVTVASLIERETAFPGDRAKVARVIYNRLDRRMPLQLDSTVNYLREEKKARLSLDDLKVESDYNTYDHTGLTPTPINSPGEAALEAAVDPAPGDYLYFVTTSKDGSALFTRDYDEFVNAKKKAQAEGVY